MSQKDAYVQKLQEQLDAWKLQMDEFRRHSVDVTRQARDEYQKQLELLQAHGDMVRRQLDATRQASEQAWLDMKVRADKAWDDLYQMTRNALDRFK